MCNFLGGIINMETVAVMMERIPLSDWGFIFRPIDIITGKIDETENVFITEQQTFYYNMNDCALFSSDGRLCYGYETSIEKLKAKSPTQELKDVLRDYFGYISQYCYMGYYSDRTGNIEIIIIPLDSIENLSTRKRTFTYEEEELVLTLSRNDVESILFDISNERLAMLLERFTKYRKSFISLEKSSSRPQATIASSNNKIPQAAAQLQSISQSALLPEAKERTKSIDIADLYQKVTLGIKSQDEQVREIITTIAMNYINNGAHNSHILISGPTGTGKSEIINLISKHINVPMTSYDMTQVSMTGYVGKSIDDILMRLYFNANKDLEKAENGILVLDEIDKKASHDNGDVACRGVLNSLLKVLDGTIFDLNFGKEGVVSFDTSKLTIVAMGAFSNLKSQHSNPIGFNQITKKIPIDICVEDYVQYGIPEEFLGRFTTIVNLNPLTVEDLKTILLTSTISPLVMKRLVLNELGVQINCTDEFIEEVAKSAIAMKTGARALRSIVEYSLKNAEFEILKDRKYSNLMLDGETVYDNKAYVLK